MTIDSLSGQPTDISDLRERLEPDGCHLFPADNSGTSAVKEYASA